MVSRPFIAPSAPPGGEVRTDRTHPTWVVMMSASPWHVAAHRQQELARELARPAGPGSKAAYRVLYMDPPPNRPSRRFTVHRESESLWHATVPAPLPFGRQIPAANRLTRWTTARSLRGWLDRRPGDRLLWIDEDLASPLIGHVGERAVVYDATDLDWTFTRRWNRWHLRRSLRAAVGRADLVMASSSALPARLPPSPTTPVVVPNACDPDMFRPDGPSVAWMQHLPRPRLGYLGAVDTRAFDGDLVASVARAHPEWAFVLVGPSTPAGRAPLAGLPNVHLFPAVPYATAPAVMRGIDVGLIPYRIGGLVDYVHPKKCYEYLACGRPVVATELPALRAIDADLALASGPAAFAEAISAALATGCRPPEVAARRLIARSNSWQMRGLQLRALLSDLEARW